MAVRTSRRAFCRFRLKRRCHVGLVDLAVNHVDLEVQGSPQRRVKERAKASESNANNGEALGQTGETVH